MNIIIPKEAKNLESQNRIIDGIHTIISLDEEQFNLVIQQIMPTSKRPEQINFYYLNDWCEIPENDIQVGLEKIYSEDGEYIGRGYYANSFYSMNQIIKECIIMLDEYPSNSIKFTRLQRLLHTRDLAAFKSFYATENKLDPLFVDKLFEILSSDKMLSDFLDYENHRKDFYINGHMVSKIEYLKHFGQVFGKKETNGETSKKKNFVQNFYIPEYDRFERNYLTIYNKTHIDRYADPIYTFSNLNNPSEIFIRAGDEPDWEISPDTRKAIIEDMPKDLSLEEKAMYIYCKMCKIFQYDEGYFYKDRLNNAKYDYNFSKEHLEGIKPGDKVTCFDFSRMYAKLINEIEGDITAVVIIKGINRGHALTGFYTEKASVQLEAMNIDPDKDSTNDLMKAKNGIMLSGVEIISDRDGVIEKALDKVYAKILGKNPMTIKEFFRKLEELPQNKSVGENPYLKLQSLLEVLKANHIFGNEFTQTLLGMDRTDFFGTTRFEDAYLGERQKSANGEESYRRFILLREIKRNGIDDSRKGLYLIDTGTLNLKICSEREIIDKMNSGELIYESEEYKLPGIDKEVE